VFTTVKACSLTPVTSESIKAQASRPSQTISTRRHRHRSTSLPRHRQRRHHTGTSSPQRVFASIVVVLHPSRPHEPKELVRPHAKRTRINIVIGPTRDKESHRYRQQQHHRPTQDKEPPVSTNSDRTEQDKRTASGIVNTALIDTNNDRLASTTTTDSPPYRLPP